MTTKANRIERYYDTHEMEGAELTQSRIHHAIILHLMLVIDWIFSGRNVGVTGNTNFYQTNNRSESSKSPDIAVVEGLETAAQNLEDTPSYYVGEDGPPPLVVFEIASKDTWRQDLEDKPAKYAEMGVQEYFVFDPNRRTLWTGQWRTLNRLIGWRKNLVTGQYDLINKDSNGRLWSEGLESWLAVEGNDLQLYTADGQKRLTEAEAKTNQLEAERQRADAENQRANVESQRADKALLKAQRLAEKLRQMGIDPEEEN